MTRTYAAVSNKGGAGKTTLVTLLAGEYAQSGDRGQHQSGRREKTGLRACESTQGHVEQVTGERAPPAQRGSFFGAIGAWCVTR
jgi:Mrp family chromosome partitioning ATPase